VVKLMCTKRRENEDQKIGVLLKKQVEQGRLVNDPAGSGDGAAVGERDGIAHVQFLTAT